LESEKTKNNNNKNKSNYQFFEVEATINGKKRGWLKQGNTGTG